MFIKELSPKQVERIEKYDAYVTSCRTRYAEDPAYREYMLNKSKARAKARAAAKRLLKQNATPKDETEDDATSVVDDSSK